MRNGLAMAVWAILIVSVLACCGCTRETGPPPPIAVDQIPVEFEKVFKTAKSEVQAIALQVSSAVQTNDYVTAFASVQALCSVSDKTKEQSVLAVRAMLTINRLLQTARSNGDEKAAETLKIYQMTK